MYTYYYVISLIFWFVKDVRSRSVSHTYTDDSPVRDVQLNPHLAVNFATACEDGSIRVCRQLFIAVDTTISRESGSPDKLGYLKTIGKSSVHLHHR